ncbi:hypothetical protein RJT34_01863 [Clitoria ternatea]|uniref:Uncharacterized protein n=1 Tax=Clitoria ternatea TaxID=43366 RepID=A0AAN9KIH9_CLITE
MMSSILRGNLSIFYGWQFKIDHVLVNDPPLIHSGDVVSPEAIQKVTTKVEEIITTTVIDDNNVAEWILEKLDTFVPIRSCSKNLKIQLMATWSTWVNLQLLDYVVYKNPS